MGAQGLVDDCARLSESAPAQEPESTSHGGRNAQGARNYHDFPIDEHGPRRMNVFNARIAQAALRI
jgi:hypothetical protein